MKRFRGIATAALLAGMAILSATTARAAIVVTISDGGVDAPVTLSTSGNTLLQAFTIGVYTGEVEVVSTNFPGTPIQGTLTTNTTITSVAGTDDAPPLTINSGVYTDTSGTTLANFTAPTGPTLLLKNDVTANGTPLNSETLTGTSTSNGTTSDPVSVMVGLDSELSNFTTITGQAPPNTGQYTLQNTSVITGVVAGDSGLALSVASTVTAPEPSTVVAAFTGIFLVGLAALRSKVRNRA